jgi:hypothetical protein
VIYIDSHLRSIIRDIDYRFGKSKKYIYSLLKLAFIDKRQLAQLQNLAKSLQKKVEKLKKYVDHEIKSYKTQTTLF